MIAELSGNHNGQLGNALRLVEAAAEAGADAIKLQTYTADTITLDHDGPEFQITEGLWKGRSLYELYDEAHTPLDWHAPLFERARKLDIVAFSSPFDPSAVDFLESLNPPVYKVASFELIDIPLVKYIAATGRPMIMSTGMANRDEIEEAITAARAAGAREIALLHCTSGYPTPPEEANLATISDLATTFGVVIGLSDHTLGNAVSVAAVSLGASLVEKHLTLSRADGGPDAAFSLEPDEFKLLVDDCRTAWRARGNVNYQQTASEQGNVRFRRSLYVVADIGEGEPFTRENVRSIRPGYGLAPKHLDGVLDRRASRNLTRGTALNWEMVV